MWKMSIKSYNKFIGRVISLEVFVFLLVVIINIEACKRMTMINPLELETLDKDNVSLPRDFRETLGKEIETVINTEFEKVEELQTKKALRIIIEELMGYGISNPCIVLGILDANLTSTYITHIFSNSDQIIRYFLFISLIIEPLRLDSID